MIFWCSKFYVSRNKSFIFFLDESYYEKVELANQFGLWDVEKWKNVTHIIWTNCRKHVPLD